MVNMILSIQLLIINNVIDVFYVYLLILMVRLLYFHHRSQMSHTLRHPHYFVLPPIHDLMSSLDYGSLEPCFNP